MFDGVAQDPVGAWVERRGGGEVLAEFGDGAGLPAADRTFPGPEREGLLEAFAALGLV